MKIGRSMVQVAYDNGDDAGKTAAATNLLASLSGDLFDNTCSFLTIRDLLMLDETSQRIHTGQLPTVWHNRWVAMQKERRAGKRDYERLCNDQTSTRKLNASFSNGVPEIPCSAKARFFHAHAQYAQEALAIVSEILTVLQNHPCARAFHRLATVQAEHQQWQQQQLQQKQEQEQQREQEQPAGEGEPQPFTSHVDVLLEEYGPIRHKLNAGDYQSFRHVVQDIRLVTRNIKQRHYEEWSAVHGMAVLMETLFETKLIESFYSSMELVTV